MATETIEETEIKSNWIDEFNNFFDGNAYIEMDMIKNRLELTVGSQTVVIALPGIVGYQSKG